MFCCLTMFWCDFNHFSLQLIMNHKNYEYNAKSILKAYRKWVWSFWWQNTISFCSYKSMKCLNSIVSYNGLVKWFPVLKSILENSYFSYFYIYLVFDLCVIKLKCTVPRILCKFFIHLVSLNVKIDIMDNHMKYVTEL